MGAAGGISLGTRDGSRGQKTSEKKNKINQKKKKMVVRLLARVTRRFRQKGGGFCQSKTESRGKKGKIPFKREKKSSPNLGNFPKNGERKQEYISALETKERKKGINVKTLKRGKEGCRSDESGFLGG